MRPVLAHPAVPPARPHLDLSGPKLRQAFALLVGAAEDHGGVERYVEALHVKARLFRESLGEGRAGRVEPGVLMALCAYMPTARRRVGPYLDGARFETLRRHLAALLDGAEDTTTADARLDAFCAQYPDDRAHRWVRDLGADVLHNVDPERYPLMSRWVWDARTNTGVLREIWHADDVDHILIRVPDRYETFLVLREELSQFLAANGVFRDVLFYVDLLTTQVYASYIGEQGGTYLRTDFASPEDPTIHLRRILGLDGMNARGRTRLKLAAGKAFVVDDRLLN